MACCLLQFASTVPQDSDSRHAPKYIVRFPDAELKEWLTQEAQRNNRSLNAEIIARL